MNLYNPDYLKHLCGKYGLAPSKRYGQNFLIDPAIVENIVARAGLKSEDVVIEVGPGFGVLTFALAEKVKQVISFEIEKKLQPYWSRFLAKNRGSSISDKAEIGSNIEIVWGNVLKSFLSSGSLGMTDNYKVVANLPYQITSPVIRLFLEAEHPPESLVLMVQKEVAERICAPPGEMSVFAVSVQYYADPEYLFTVPRSSFWPIPRVDSAVIRLSLRARLIGASAGEAERTTRQSNFEKQFFHIVKAGFANRRKLLSKNLEPVVGKNNKEKLKKIFADLGFGPNTRAQELSVEQWKKLGQLFYPLTCP